MESKHLGIAVPFSTERAKSVASLLVSAIGDPARVSYVGFGSSKPKVKAYGPFDEGAVKNRRTEVYLCDETGTEFPARKALPQFTPEEIRQCRADGERRRSTLHERIDEFANFCFMNNMEGVVQRIQEVRNIRSAAVDGTAAFLRFIYPVLDAFRSGCREEENFMKIIDDVAQEFYREIGE